MLERLCLGTAQLGFDYGAANKIGKPDNQSSLQILHEAWQSGIRFFDTAEEYGSSEQLLGSFFGQSPERRQQARVITKFCLNESTQNDLKSWIVSTLERINCNKLWGGMLHREEDLSQAQNIFFRQLADVKKEGLLKYFGVSCYSPNSALAALGNKAVDIIQIPMNVFDQRWTKVIEEASHYGKQVFIRSVYLQGVALMDPAEVPSGIPKADAAVSMFKGFCAEREIERDHFAFSYVYLRAPQSIVVVGAESKEQVYRNCEIAGLSPVDSKVIDDWDNLYSCPDLRLIDPSKWALQRRN